MEDNEDGVGLVWDGRKEKSEWVLSSLKFRPLKVPVVGDGRA